MPVDGLFRGVPRRLVPPASEPEPSGAPPYDEIFFIESSYRAWTHAPPVAWGDDDYAVFVLISNKKDDSSGCTYGGLAMAQRVARQIYDRRVELYVLPSVVGRSHQAVSVAGVGSVVTALGSLLVRTGGGGSYVGKADNGGWTGTMAAITVGGATAGKRKAHVWVGGGEGYSWSSHPAYTGTTKLHGMFGSGGGSTASDNGAGWALTLADPGASSVTGGLTGSGPGRFYSAAMVQW